VSLFRALLDLWPAANTGEFRLCPACVSALARLADRTHVWDMNIEAYGYPTAEMMYAAEYEVMAARIAADAEQEP
jgi:hypothetical protein